MTAEFGICPVCDRRIALADGLIRAHNGGTVACAGRGQKAKEGRR